MSAPLKVGVIGARGHVGAELISLIGGHPALALAFATSRHNAGEAIPGANGAVFETLDPDDVAARGADCVFLALPNDKTGPYVAALETAAPKTGIIDMGADYRFDSTWVYGLSERARSALCGARRIANPGCYATAAQLAIGPLVDRLAAPPAIFGVSGYSGAGTTPSRRNDKKALGDNLMPYALAGHMHEREIAHQLGAPVHFMPHVASFFRGLSVTVDMVLEKPLGEPALNRLYEDAYGDEALVHVGMDIPEVRDVAGTNMARIGGLTLANRGRRVVAVCVLDNLRKGAASQAIQNLNLAFGMDECAGLET